jgi:MtfA peptidase
MLFSWLKSNRRRTLLAEPFPSEWLSYLHKNVLHYSWLSEAEQARLRDDLRVFSAEKHWEGCGGLEINDEMKVTVAAHACLLILGLNIDCYNRVPTILIYPSGFQIPSKYDGTDVIFEGDAAIGQAVYRGPVILSWEDVLAEGRDPGGGRNVVFHEFAHELDMLNGSIDGTPLLETDELTQRWQQVMTREFERLIAASDRGQATLLDDYGATNEGEFFAVATECFFNQPVEMQRRHRRLYELLREYYRQDPAARSSRKAPPPEAT